MIGSNPLFVWYIIMEVINMLVDQHARYSPSTPLVKKNLIFSTTCFDLMKSLSGAVCHAINMSLIVYNCSKPLLCYHVLLIATDDKIPCMFYCE
jgi:hypothetical protein